MSDESPSPPPIPSEKESEAQSGYQTFAETVGGVPSLRKKDNLVQGLSVLVGTLVGAAVGYFVWGGIGAVGLGLAGMIGSLLISGLVLMVLGWIRAVK